MVWWLLLAGCQVVDGEGWSRSDPGWDLGEWDCWEPVEPAEKPEEQCQRDLEFTLGDWEGEGGDFTGTWTTGLHGEGTVDGSWQWLDGATRQVSGTWEDGLDPGRGGELHALAWTDQHGRPQLSGSATSEDERIWIGGPGAVTADGDMAGVVTWSFAEAHLDGWFLPRGTWVGHGLWEGGIMYAEGSWERVDDEAGQLFGTVYHGQWSGIALGGFEVGTEGPGTVDLWVDRWGAFQGALVFEGPDAASFALLGFPEGC